MVSHVSQLTGYLVRSMPYRALIWNVVDDLVADHVRYPQIRDAIDCSQIWSVIDRPKYAPS